MSGNAASRDDAASVAITLSWQRVAGGAALAMVKKIAARLPARCPGRRRRKPSIIAAWQQIAGIATLFLHGRSIDDKRILVLL